MAARAVRRGDYGVTVEVPDGLVRVVRRLRPTRPRATATSARFQLHATPPFSVDSRADEIVAARAFALGAAATTMPEVDAPEAAATHPWYHSIEFPDGTVTPGFYDHRELLAHYGLPDDLLG